MSNSEILQSKYDNYNSSYSQLTELLKDIIEKGEYTKDHETQLDVLNEKYDKDYIEVKQELNNAQDTINENRLSEIQSGTLPREQQQIFNALTQNGKIQGLYMDEDGELYLNAEFLQTRGLKVVNEEGVATLHIDEDGNLTTSGDIVGGTITGTKLQALTIDTNEVNIESNDGGMVLRGALQQFKDENNRVRIQIGKNEQGNFNFTLFGQNGEAVLIDENGIKAEAISANMITGGHISSDSISTKHLKAEVFEAVDAKIDNAVIGKADIEDLTAINADIKNLKVEDANIKNLVAEKADIKELTAINADIKNIKAEKADITDLEAVNAKIGNLVADVGEIDHLLAGNITAENIQAGTITAESGIIAEGAIGNAQISSVDAGKISAGRIDTSLVEIAGNNNHLKLKGNRIQVFQGVGNQAKERVSLGDVNGDGTLYGLRVRGADGQTILLDENGVKPEGITDGSITNEKINENANIDGEKININSVVDKINEDGTKSIVGTKINVGDGTLTAKLSNITEKQTEHGESIKQAQSDIVANEKAISLKVSEQVYEKDKTETNTKFSNVNSEISAMKDEIALKVESTDIDSAVKKINDNLTTNYSTTAQMNSAITASKEAIELGVSKKYATNEKITDINNNLKNNYSTTSDMNAAIKASADSITTSVSKTYASKEEVKNLNIGTRNRLKGTSEDISFTGTNTVNQCKTLYRFDSSKSDIVGQTLSMRFTYTVTNYVSGTIYIQTQPDKYVQLSNKITPSGNGTFTANYTTGKFTSAEFASTQLRLDNFQGTVTISKMMLVTGDKPCDWEISPDDIDGLITSKGYQTASDVQQTVDKLEVKFSESGGYNLLYNGNFKNGFTSWGTQGSPTIINSASCKDNNIAVQMSGALNTTKQVYQDVLNLNYAGSLMLSQWVYLSTGTKGTTNYYVGTQVTVEYTDGTKAYPGTGAPTTFDTWVRQTILINPPAGKRIKHIYVGVYCRDTTQTFYVTDIIISKGKMEVPFSPNPNEVHDGVTAIDKDGITVTASNVKSKTSMSANGFKITKTDTGEEVFKVNADGTLSLKGSMTITGGSVPTNALSGTISSSQLNSSITTDISNAKNNASSALSTANTAKDTAETAKSTATTAKGTADTAKSTADTAKSTADSAKSTAGTANTNATNALNTANSVNKVVNDNKSSWDNAYKRVVEWAYGAVGGSTTINGGLIETDTISAKHIAIGDFTNYCEANPYNCTSYGFTKVDSANDPWMKAKTIQRDMTLCSTSTYEAYKGNIAGTYYIEYELASTVKGSPTSGGTTTDYLTVGVGLYCKKKDGTSTWNIVAPIKSNSTGSVQKASGRVTIDSSIASFTVFLQHGGYGPFTGETKIRNIRVNKMSSGELIVDGAITTSKIHANGLDAGVIKAGTISADRISVDTLRGKTITGGTISGGTVTGATITGGQINISSGKFKVDTSGNVTTAGNFTLGGTVTANGNITATNLKLNGGSISLGSNFSVSSSGVLTAKSANFTGTINSGSTINGSNIRGGSLFIGSASGETDGHVFRIYSDGRVYSKKVIQVYGAKEDGDYSQLAAGKITTTGYVQSSGYKTDNMTMYFAVDGADVNSPTGDNGRRIKLTRNSEGNTYFAPDYPSTIRLGTQNYMWNIAYIKNGVSSSSDRTLKENIYYISEDMPNARAVNNSENIIREKDLYDFVKNDLFMAQFNFIGDDKTTVGFIAQDLLYNADGSDNKIGQLIVNKPDDEQAPLTYNEKAYVNVLAGALKEAISKIEELERKIESMA